MFYMNADAPSHPGGPDPWWGGWVYLGYDYKRLGETKIGITTRPIFTRISESPTNPYYVLFAAFHVPNCDYATLLNIEEYLSRKLRIGFVRHPSGADSEWMMCSPCGVMRTVLEKLPNVLAIDSDGEYDYTRSIYLPQIYPYDVDIGGEEFHRMLRFSAPSFYLQELTMGRKVWDARPDFLSEVSQANFRNGYAITGPQILLDRMNYDLIRGCES